MSTSFFPNYNSLGVYALYLKNPYYIGPVIRIIRASDSTQLDFYADAAGNLTNTSTAGIQTTYSAWIFATTGKVVIWYDQSGNGNNLMQFTAAYQPAITRKNGIYFNGGGVGMSFITPVKNCYSVATQLYTGPNAYQTILSSSFNDAIGLRFINSNVCGNAFVASGSNYNADFVAPYNSYFYVNNSKGSVGGTLRNDGTGSATVAASGAYSDNTWNYFVATRDRDLISIPSYGGSNVEPFVSLGNPTNAGLFATRSLIGYMRELILLNNKITDADAALLYTNTTSLVPTVAAAPIPITNLSGTTLNVNWGAFGDATNYVIVSWTGYATGSSPKQTFSASSYTFNGAVAGAGSTYTFTITPYYTTQISGAADLAGVPLTGIYANATSAGGTGTSVTTPALASAMSFSAAGITSANGPSLATLTAYYTNTYIKNYLTMGINGIQLWTVPVSGVYTIYAAGASGYYNTTYEATYTGGRGAIMSGKLPILAGTLIAVLVGQMPGVYSSGAGGTFVVNYNAYVPLLVAGGGGGMNASVTNGYDATASGTGVTGASTTRTAGAVGGAGPVGGGGILNIATGGAGFSGNGNLNLPPAYSFTQGGAGCPGNYSGSYPGGFGGGGATESLGWSGGGGGYGGGGAGYAAGGGGGSYVIASAANVATNTYNAYATNGYALFALQSIDVVAATIPITNLTPTSLTVNWGAFNPQVSYVIVSWASAAGSGTSPNQTTTASSYAVTGLTAAQTYTFTITPYNAVGTAGTPLTGASANASAATPSATTVYTATPVTVSTAPYPLDGLSAAALSSANALYAIRRLLTSYTGPVINIRSSAGPVSDFYADLNGNLTTGTNGTGTAYATWIGANTGYVTTWYDQSGKNAHATQTTTTLQPSFNYKNTWVDFTTQAGWFNMPDGTIPYGDSSYTIIFKYGAAVTATNVVYGGGSSLANQLNGFLLYTNGYYLWWGGDDQYGGTVSGYSTVTTQYTQGSGGTARLLYVEGGATGLTLSGTAGIRANPNTPNYLGKPPFTSFSQLNTQLYYIAFFNSALSVADRTAVEAQGSIYWRVVVTNAAWTYGQGITVDANDNFYLAGRDQESSPAIYNAVGGSSVPITSSGAGGGTAAFIIKYNRYGYAQWSASLSMLTNNQGSAVPSTDSLGNVYFCGTYGLNTPKLYDSSSATVAVAGLNAFPTTTTNNAFLVKLNSAGIAQWYSVLIGSSTTFGTGVTCSAVDVYNNVCVCGYYAAGTAPTFQDSSYGNANLTFPASTVQAAFLIRYTSAGIAQWRACITGTGQGIVGSSIATDSLCNIYMAGYYGSNATLNDASGTANGITFPAASGNAAMLVKFNAGGVGLWRVVIEGPGSDYSSGGGGVAVDASNNVYFGGAYGSGTPATINDSSGGASGKTLPTSTKQGGFLLKVNAAGITQWRVAITGGGSTDTNNVTAVTIDVNQNIYIAGTYLGGAVINDASGANSSVTLSATNSAFVIKLNSAGIAQWAVTANFGGIANIRTDSVGNVYIGGTYGNKTTAVVITNSSGVASTLTFPDSGIYSCAAYSVKISPSGFI